MKPIKTITVFIPLLLLYSCEFFDIDYDTYTIRNESDYEVIVNAYSHSQFNQNTFFIQSILIPPHEQYDTIKLTGEDEGTTGYFMAEPDSVIISFSEERKKVYTCSTPYDNAQNKNTCQEEGNIIQYMDTPNTFDNKRKGYDYVYTITNRDYENAIEY